MEPVKRFPFGFVSALDTSNQGDAFGTHNTNVPSLIGKFDGVGTGVAAFPRSSPQDWSKLIDRVRQVAQHAREVEAHAQAQDLRVQEVLDRVRQDVQNAAESVRVAEARTTEIQSRSDALLKAADKKVLAAEERARIAEEWLARLHETIVTEFAGDPESKQAV